MQVYCPLHCLPTIYHLWFRPKGTKCLLSHKMHGVSTCFSQKVVTFAALYCEVKALQTNAFEI